MSNICMNANSYDGAHFARMSNNQCEKLHNASLEILSRTGVALHDQEAIDLLKKAGAFVSDGNRVRIPAGLVEKAFSTVPKRVTLYDRYGKPACLLEGYHVYYGTGSDCLNIIDHRNGEHRRAVLNDVVEGITVCDSLPNIDFVMSMFLPSDIDEKVSDRYQMDVMLNGTTKPIVYVTNELSGCIDDVKMAEAVVGGEEVLRQKPLISCYINATSGLIHNKEALQKLLFLSGKGLPAQYIPCTTGGMHAPITPASVVAVNNAGLLTGLVLSQLKREGAPFIAPAICPSRLDMKTMIIPYCLPDSKGIPENLAHYYNLPMFTTGGCSDSPTLDEQAVSEASLMLMVEALSGGHLVHDLGYLEAGLTCSFVLLTICDEVIGFIEHFLAPVEINDETLALDIIDELGPEGSYLETEHTMNHFKEDWMPGLFQRYPHDRWKTKGELSLADISKKRVDDILAEHTPEPLPEHIQKNLKTIIHEAEKKAGIR